MTWRYADLRLCACRENLATILQLDLGRTSVGEGEFGEGVGADIDLTLEEEILKRSREGSMKEEGDERVLKKTEKKRRGTVTEREKETGLKRAGSGLGLKRGSSLKEGETVRIPDPSEELLAKALPLTRGWESPRVESGAGSSKGRAAAASDSTQHQSFKLQFALLRAGAVWSRFEEIVASAQVAPAEEAATLVDFGPLTFVEPGLDVDMGQGRSEKGVGAGGAESAEGDIVKGSREREVRRIFGLEDMDIWSACLPLLSSVLIDWLI